MTWDVYDWHDPPPIYGTTVDLVMALASGKRNGVSREPSTLGSARGF